jgi:hypothetical protein
MASGDLNERGSSVAAPLDLTMMADSPRELTHAEG